MVFLYIILSFTQIYYNSRHLFFLCWFSHMKVVTFGLRNHFYEIKYCFLSISVPLFHNIFKCIWGVFDQMHEIQRSNTNTQSFWFCKYKHVFVFNLNIYVFDTIPVCYRTKFNMYRLPLHMKDSCNL